MPEVTITIGGRDFEVSCQVGEEHFLQSAAKLLNNEASVLATQAGHISAERMLLMAGLMLADKTAGIEEQLQATETKLGAQEALIADLRAQPTPEPERVEVPVVPEGVREAFAELTARAESVAQSLEDQL